MCESLVHLPLRRDVQSIASPRERILGDSGHSSPVYLVLSIHRDFAKVPGYDRRTSVRGELYPFAYQLEGRR